VSNLAAARSQGDDVHTGDAHEIQQSSARAGSASVSRRSAARVQTPGQRLWSLLARGFGVVGLSVGAHMGLLGILGFVRAPSVEEAKQVEMEIVEPEPPPAAPEPEPEPEPEPPKPAAPEPARPKLAPKLAAAPKAAAPEPTNEPPPAAEAPVDLTGVTLTGDSASWSSVVGTGAPMTGPAPRIGRVTGNDRAGASDGVVGGKGTGPVIVPEGSLSRSPGQPEGMGAMLEQHYPPRAKAQGISGSALVRVRILADGRVSDIKLVRETGDHGFGAACMKVLRLKRWQPPLDKRGQPVATEIKFSCDFEVSY